ncbi:MAG: formimidoylglutamate deiminase [Sandaracinaceae bacterium]
MSAAVLGCPAACLPEGWRERVRLRVVDGMIAEVESHVDLAGVPMLPGPVIPGMANAHSHAFQWAMAGLAERATGAEDSFWTWRRAMYGLVAALGPEEVEAIAASAYADLLEAGYTHVAEFHYLHHQADGTPYADRAELALRVVEAARRTGIGLTLLPVLYARGGVGGRPPTERQRPFVTAPDDLLALIARLRAVASGVRVGLALHSLRAVTPAELDEAVTGLERLDPTAPVHIHVAEQSREVEEVRAALGAPPVRWLASAVPLGPRWSLVHATHVDADEVATVARARAVVVLCPTTEANLGDGRFPTPAYVEAGGALAVGSDSHVVVDPAEELRLLEVDQRLTRERRLVLRTDGDHIGAGLWRRAAEGGATAVGVPTGRLAVGHRADLVVLDGAHPRLQGREGDALLDTFVLAGRRGLVREVWVAGERVVADGRHAGRARLDGELAAALAALRRRGWPEAG